MTEASVGATGGCHQHILRRKIWGEELSLRMGPLYIKVVNMKKRIPGVLAPSKQKGKVFP